MIKFVTSWLVVLVLLAGCAQPTGQGRDIPLTDTPIYGKFIWHDLITDDVAAAKRFYGALFGWTFEDTTRPGGGDYVLIISKSGHYVAGMVALADPQGDEDYSRWLGYYSVPDVDGAARAAQSAGGTVAVAPTDIGQVARVAVIRDPESAVVGMIDSRVGYPEDDYGTGLGHVVWNELVAADPVTAGGFYAKLSNGSITTDDRARGVYRIITNDGRPQAGIMQRPDDDLDPLWLSYFSVADANEAVLRASELGGEVLMPPLPDVRDGSIALIVDPTGAVLALQQ